MKRAIIAIILLSSIIILGFFITTASGNQGLSSSQERAMMEGLIKAETTAKQEAAKQEVGVRSEFRTAVNKAASALVQEGELTRLQALRLRIAMRSPAFRKHAEDLAIIQMYYSGDPQTADYLPMDETGVVVRGSINWEGLMAFLKAFLPMLLELLQILGAV